MTRLAPISARELQAVLTRLGLRLIRQKGSHAFWEHEGGRATIVPIHKGEGIGQGLLRRILADLDIEPEELAKLRRKRRGLR